MVSVYVLDIQGTTVLANKVRANYLVSILKKKTKYIECLYLNAKVSRAKHFAARDLKG